MSRTLRTRSPAGPPPAGTAARRRRRPAGSRPPLCLELLEDRNLLAATALTPASPRLISDAAGGGSNAAAVSRDGRYVAYQSTAANLVVGESNPDTFRNVYLYDSAALTTTLVSHAVTATTASANGDSSTPSVSADGRFVVFESAASNLVAGITKADPGAADVYLFDRMAPVTNNVRLLSRDSANPTTGNAASDSAVISADGNFVAYRSFASNLVAGQSQSTAVSNVFVADLATGLNQLASGTNASPTITANGASDSPVISGDGNYVAYRSDANTLAPGEQDANNGSDVYLFSRRTGAIQVVSHNFASTSVTSDRPSDSPAINSDGTNIAFRSFSTNLVAGENRVNTSSDVYLYNRINQSVQLISHTAISGTTTGDAGSDSPVVSGDGSATFVAYRSFATTLGPTRGSASSDVYLNDLVLDPLTRLTTNALVSRASSGGGTSGNAGSDSPALSADGSTVLFRSLATDLVTGLMTNPGSLPGGNLFAFQRTTGAVTLVSRNNQAVTNTGDNASYAGAAQNYPPPPPGLVPLPGISSLVPFPTPLSGDGRFVAFSSFANDLVPTLRVANGADNVYRYDRTSVATTLVSLRTPLLGSSTAGGSSSTSTSPGPSVSADGRYVTFVSTGVNLISLTPAGGGATQDQVDSNLAPNVYLYDRTLGTITLVSHTSSSLVTTASAASGAPTLSGDGRFVAYLSSATDLVAGETVVPPPAGMTLTQVYVYDRMTGANRLVSHNSATLTTTANRNSGGAVSGADGSSLPALSPVIGADGSSIAFVSLGTDLVAGQNDTNLGNDVFVYDQASQGLALVSGAGGSSTVTGNAASDSPSISDDGSAVAFRSDAINLSPGEVSSTPASNVYLFNRRSGVTTLVSHNSALPILTAAGASDSPVLSGDGSAVAFVSTANNLVPGQISGLGVKNVFEFDRTSGANRLVSHVAGNSVTAGNDASDSPALSVDGGYVAFSSLSTNLVAGQIDTNGFTDVFEYTRTSDTNALVSHSSASAVITANAASSGPRMSRDGRVIVYTSAAGDLVKGEVKTSLGNDAFAFDRVSGANLLVSANTAGTASAPQAANGPSSNPVVSGNGTTAVFASSGSDLVRNDLNSTPDVFALPLILVPGDLMLSSTAVPEFQPPGTTVGTFTTTDTNPGAAPFTYALVAGVGSTDNGSFRIVGSTLQTAVVLPDRSVKPTYSIRVSTTDALGQVLEKAFTLTVGFANVAPTDLAVVPSSVPELSPVGTTVGTFVTTDPNVGDTFTYALVAGAGGADNGSFTIAGNTLQTAAVFNANVKSSYSIRVRTTDAGGLFLDKALTITVTPVAQAPTDILLSNNRVVDLSPANTPVGVLSAVSPTAGVTFTFRLVPGPGGADNTFFTISGTTLLTTDLSGGSHRSPYSIRVRVTDSNGLSFEKPLTIIVLRNPAPQTPGMFDPNTATWYLRNSSNSGRADAGVFQYGGPGWVPVVGDWDGDGKETVGVVDPRTATWYLRNTVSAGFPDIPAFQYGLPGWIPVVGDWTGSGHTGIGMFDPTTGFWYLRNSASAGAPDFVPFAYGLPNWKPITGDWMNNGRTGIGVVYPTNMTWFLRVLSGPGFVDLNPFPYGGIGWKPVVGDWDGTGAAKAGVVDPFGRWYLRVQNSAGPPSLAPFLYGLGSWTPIAGDWDFPRVPQRAAGGPRLDDPAPPALTDAEVQTAVDTALARLENSGVSAAVLKVLRSASYATAVLPGDDVGLTDTFTHQVWFSPSAAGYGWFQDATAASDAQFDAAGKARAGSEAAGKMDLLTVVLHEMSHLVGRPDQAGPGDSSDLLVETLAAGERRVQALDLVFGV